MCVLVMWQWPLCCPAVPLAALLQQQRTRHDGEQVHHTAAHVLSPHSWPAVQNAEMRTGYRMVYCRQCGIGVRCGKHMAVEAGVAWLHYGASWGIKGRACTGLSLRLAVHSGQGYAELSRVCRTGTSVPAA